MKLLIYMYHHIDDIIFKGRNKRYGAYELRATYDLRMARAMFFSISAFVMLVCAPFLFGRKIPVMQIGPPNDDFLHDETITYVELEPKEVIKSIQKGASAAPSTKSASINNFNFTTDTLETVSELAEVVNSTETGESGNSTSEVFGSETGSMGGSAVGVEESNGDSNTGIVDNNKPEEVFISVEQMPVFGAGIQDLFDYLSKNIKYPALAREYNITGVVVLQFVVNRQGKVSQVSLVKGIGGGCDEEAMRVIRQMPDWSPGKQQGRPVSVKFTLPVSFKLQK